MSCPRSDGWYDTAVAHTNAGTGSVGDSDCGYDTIDNIRSGWQTCSYFCCQNHGPDFAYYHVDWDPDHPTLPYPYPWHQPSR